MGICAAFLTHQRIARFAIAFWILRRYCFSFCTEAPLLRRFASELTVRWSQDFFCQELGNRAINGGGGLYSRRRLRRRQDEEEDATPWWLSHPSDGVDFDAISGAKRGRRGHDNRNRKNLHDYKNDWGMTRVDQMGSPPSSRFLPSFPFTVESLTDEAFRAIAGTLYDKMRPDPNIMTNAMRTNNGIVGYRPVRHPKDAGRVGIEIDGARHLFFPQIRKEHDALRHVVLRLASKLSDPHWDDFETCDNIENNNNNNNNNNEDTKSDSRRPVAIFFNTINHCLEARREMSHLQSMTRKRRGDDDHGPRMDDYSSISLNTLGDDPTIPDAMLPPSATEGKKKKKNKQHLGGMRGGTLEPKRGIIVVVQPTDYNTEFRPPGPAVTVLPSLQKLAARAAVSLLPVIVITPRFLSHPDHHHQTRMDQSGYQRSSVFGGAEPPLGPTPWFMRDFTPPVFVWVSDAYQIHPNLFPPSLLRRSKRRPSQRGRGRVSGGDDIDMDDDDDDGVRRDEMGRYFVYTKMSLLQSVMLPQHSWHIFAAKQFSSSRLHHHHHHHEYLVSTGKSLGRPTLEILKRIFSEWSDSHNQNTPSNK